MKIIKKIVYETVPAIENNCVNKSLRKKLSPPKEQSQYPTVLSQSQNAENISTETLQVLYLKELEIKDKLEDKAKATIMCVTISISLILGASNLLSSISNLYNSLLLNWIVYVLFCISVLYMILAAIMDIKVLVAENTVYIEQPDWNEEERRIGLDDCIGRNRIKNIIRNNYIYTAYRNIRNALICLFIILLISSLPTTNHSTKIAAKPSNSVFSFSSTVVDSVSDEELIILKDIVSRAMQSNEIEEGKPYSLTDKGNGKYVKFVINNGIITILDSATIAIEQ